MSLKIDKCKRIPVRSRAKIAMFRSKSKVPYVTEANSRFIGATGIINGTYINGFNKLVFLTLDKLNPFLQKHPLILKFVMSLDEKLIRFSENHSGNKLFA
jgi:hypothetical protein